MENQLLNQSCKKVRMETSVISSHGQSCFTSGMHTRSQIRNLMALSTFISTVEPRNVKEALKDVDWINSMQEELHEFERSQDSNFICLIYEVQIVSNGCQECLSEWVIEGRSICLPPGFEDVDLPNHVPKLDKAINGLKQAPRVWYEMLSKFLIENGFNRGKIDNNLFLKSRVKKLLIVQVYVDDIIFGATSESLCKDFAALMETMSKKDEEFLDYLTENDSDDVEANSVNMSDDDDDDDDDAPFASQQWPQSFRDSLLERVILKFKVESISHEENKVGEATTRPPRLEGPLGGLYHYTKEEGKVGVFGFYGR
ncbi:hypothetical protein MTR67_013067 [Solanum verrucosum]|uniref:Reverse transcriptase Ty1/copia-type domain-containing protein n=1 Tax=Solanum verrucosum TaxID=315347 RepID=A0AAF0QB24_SOLVR|nr:hypothetical protein MTR67_013067 [Solanum verrucosum]